MRRKGFLTVLLVAAGLAITAVPAFTADQQVLTLTVTAQPVAQPCVEFATGPGEPGTDVDFGTLDFSTPALASHRWSDVTPRFSNCGSATAKLFIAGTDATNVCSGLCEVHAWTLAPMPGTPCPTLNRYGLFWGVDARGIGLVDKTNTLLEKSSNPSDRYAPGESHALNLALLMPCGGSVGAGERFRLNVTLTATVA